MLVPCFLAGSIVYEIVGTQAKLRSDKFDKSKLYSADA